MVTTTENNTEKSSRNLPVIPNRDRIHIFAARIEDISSDRNTTFVTVSYHDCRECARPEDLVTLIVNQDTIIHNERGRLIRASELRPGMIINATYSAAMTRSIPPQAQAFRIRVLQRAPVNETTTGRIIEVNTRNQFIVTIKDWNPASRIHFNLSPETVILDSAGRRIRLSMLRPGLRVRVEHASFMTASIPPQTTAFIIQIIR